MNARNLAARNTGDLLDDLLGNKGRAVVGVKRRRGHGLLGGVRKILGLGLVSLGGSSLVVSHVGSSPFDLWRLSHVQMFSEPNRHAESENWAKKISSASSATLETTR